MTLLLLLAAQGAVEVEHVSFRAGGNLLPATARDSRRARVIVGGAARCAGFEKALLESAGVDAIAVGFDELDAARTETLPFTCANVVDETTGKPIAKTHVIVTIGKTRIAFVGVTKPVRKLQPPKGLRLDDPAAVLQALIPKLEADAVVILAVMDRLEAAQLLKDVPGVAAALVPVRGANDPESVKIGNAWLAQSPDAEGVAGRLALTSGANSFVRVELAEKDWDRLRALGAKHGVDPAKFVSKKKPTDGIAEGPAENRNRALEVRVESFQVVSEYAGRKAADGRAWLVVGSEWTNVIPMSYVYGTERPVAFHIGDFNEILFAVVNGSRLARLQTELTSGPGGLTEREFKLEYLGSSRRGVAVFDVPASGIESLEMRFYDFSHGHIRLPLLRKDGAAPKPVASAKNELLEAEVRSFRKDPTGAPDGMTFVRVDLGARSVWELEVDATAFDPKAKKDDRTRVPTLGRWEDLDRLISLVVDGDSAVAPRSAASAILLPDATTGEELVFLVPKSAKSLELRIDFVPMGVPGREDPLLPAPIVLALEGRRPSATQPKALVTAQDGDVRLDVTARTREGRFLVVEISILNEGEGRFFDAVESLRYVPEQGEPVPLHETTRPPKFLPKGERRVFRAVFEIDEKAKKHRISFGEQVIDLP